MVDEVFTIAQVAEKLSVPQSSIRRALSSGKLTGFKFGKHWRISRTKLEDFIAHSEAMPVEDKVTVPNYTGKKRGRPTKR